MEAVEQAIRHTPWWVFVLFAYLMVNAVRISRPGIVSLARLAIVPAIFVAWGLLGLSERYGLSPVILLCWVVALAAGAALGHLLLRRIRIQADHARGLIARPGDPSFLPLVLLVFALNYAFAYMAAQRPDIRAEAGFFIANAIAAGIFAGIFLGKLLTYYAKYRAAPSVPLAPAGP
jgi:hypothetical protein